MTCAEALHVQAYFDGEIDAVAALEVEQHVERCAECRALLADMERIRGSMRALPAPVMTAALRRRIDAVLDAEESGPSGSSVAAGNRIRPVSFWLGALSGVSVSAVAAALALLLVWAPTNDAMLDELVADHVRSLVPNHLIEVESTDQHTVKPWFAGRADVSPIAADLAAQGYRLIGGRTDGLAGQRAAVVVYGHGRHFINVFGWIDAPGPLPPDSTRRGYHLMFWRAGGVRYCAITDAAWDELEPLVRLLRALGTGDAAGP